MKNIKSLLLKIILVGILIVAMNFIYKFLFLEKDIEKHSPIISLVRNVVNDKAEVVYVGESSNLTFCDNDIDKRMISDFISEYYPSLKFGSITKEACHAGIFYELLRNIPKNSSVKTVIVTLNLRSFDANWIYSNLETPLQKSIVLLKDNPPLYNRFLLSFAAYGVKTDNERQKQFFAKWEHDILKFPEPFEYKNVIEWDKGMAIKGILNPDGSRNEELTILACHYIKTYAFQIDTLSNPRIKDFDKIVALAKERNWNLVFNLLAENTQKANKLVGNRLIYLIRQNRDLLVKRYNKNNVVVVDNLEAVNDEEFIDQNWTTEHYVEQGRKIIAANVATSLQLFYPGKFVKVNYNSSKKYSFTNDCEGQNTWGQMSTISNDRAFSGTKSSKTGNGQDFSITFNYPIKSLPDSLNKLNIDFHLFQSEIVPKAAFSIEIVGDKIGYNLKQFLLKDITKATGKWDSIHLTFDLPAYFYNGDIIKVYLYNPTSSIVYIDDLSLKFNKETTSN